MITTTMEPISLHRKDSFDDEIQVLDTTINDHIINLSDDCVIVTDEVIDVQDDSFLLTEDQLFQRAIIESLKAAEDDVEIIVPQAHMSCKNEQNKIIILDDDEIITETKPSFDNVIQVLPESSTYSDIQILTNHAERINSIPSTSNDVQIIENSNSSDSDVVKNIHKAERLSSNPIPFSINSMPSTSNDIQIIENTNSSDCDIVKNVHKTERLSSSEVEFIEVKPSTSRCEVQIISSRETSMCRDVQIVTEPQPSTSGYQKGKKRKLDDDVVFLPCETKKAKVLKDPDCQMSWTCEEVLAAEFRLEFNVIATVIRFIKNKYTVPFVCRYRQEQTNNLDPSKLREIEASYRRLLGVRQRINDVIEDIEKKGKMTEHLLSALRAAKTMEEVERLYAPYTKEKQETPEEIERRRILGPVAEGIINYITKVPELAQYINTSLEGLKTEEEIKEGLVVIISNYVTKDKDIMDHVRSLSFDGRLSLVSNKMSGSEAEGENEKSSKFGLYSQFKMSTEFVQPHQILAINRGEKLKILKVQVDVPDALKVEFILYACNKWSVTGREQRAFLMTAAFNLAWKTHLQPLLTDLTRSQLRRKGEDAALSQFSSCLRDLLQTRPVRGKVVIGLDPGFTHGCKVAVVSTTGEVLDAGVINIDRNRAPAEQVLIGLVLQHNVNIIAIGNGQGCRQAEQFVSDIIQKNAFYPQDVVYSIINERGASVYSISEQAEKELPGLGCELRGAVTIARRVIDPLVEYVKVDARHIGVGMYQHDMPEDELQECAEAVMVDTVSFVGVDLNTCPDFLLCKVAGLNGETAKNIVEWRNRNKRFVNRLQLCSVDGIDSKTFEQCAGFVRILPNQNPKVGDPEETICYEPLDMTCIHPESYQLAKRIIEDLGAGVDEVGSEVFIKKVEQFVVNVDFNILAEMYSVGVPTIKLIVDALTEPLGHDYRSAYSEPMFSSAIKTMESLKTGTKITGQVVNVTSFGVFVDVGVERPGLIHQSTLCYNGRIGVGNRVEVLVTSVQPKEQKLSLKLERIL